MAFTDVYAVGLKSELNTLVGLTPNQLLLVEELRGVRYKFLDNAPGLTADGDNIIAPTGGTGNERFVKQYVALSGSIVMWPSNTIPEGYYVCNGAAKSRTDDAILFAIIGTTYGAGDGSTTFNIPDLQQKFPLGKAASGTGSTLGSTGGAIDHLHSIDPPNTTTTASANLNNVSLLNLGTAAAPSHTHDVNIAAFNSATSNPPFVVVNYIIKN